MSTLNRRISPETYDPKQRVVGGVVLFLIMLLIYSLLKLLLGVSSASDAAYALREALPDEILSGQGAATGSPALTTGAAQQNTKALPSGFVFLDIDGKPMLGRGQAMEDEQYVTDNNQVSSTSVSLTGTHWIVQASSFREESRADRLVEQLKDKGLDAEVHRIGDWYTVRLTPQGERKEAEKQLRQLKNLMGLNGLIKKVN
ncbi:hypothetical protein TPSD3_07430 [Thioflexithrix psekupsensis]|uniref:SPOR domain-containing protein n=2 Tax=Thioflexithrix psekupsensis TaxID=1570016 RepID=A0A251X837_9GAMM|nr:hypothetical protein TPSD3_07430 [Thioflexithrix psekupsensis]